jgi:CRISPR-associated protein Csm4
MKTLKCTLEPTSPFATDFRGDSLFGHLCWAIRRLQGEAKLRELLEGYTEQEPFLIVGDPLPQGCLPRPALPIRLMIAEGADASIDKRIKKAPYLSEDAIHVSSSSWIGNLCHGPKNTAEESIALIQKSARMSNSISRLTGTTGEGAMFAPRSLEIQQYRSGTLLDCIVKIDERRLSDEEFASALKYVASRGYGKRSTVGFGQFNISRVAEKNHHGHKQPNAILTLSRSVPTAESINLKLSHYGTCTHFGRHGDELAHGMVFKSPILMFESGAVLVPEGDSAELHAHVEQGWVGNGVGGSKNPISRQLPETVHQGYAPTIPVCISWEKIDEH